MHPLLRSLIVAIATVVEFGAAPTPAQTPAPHPHVRGRVFDAATKTPLPDAFVGIFFLPPGPAKADDPERIADAVRIDPWITADGSFDIEVPERFGPGSEVFLFAQARAHAEWRMCDLPRRWRDARPATLAESDVNVDVAMTRGPTLEGRVTDIHGAPLGGVRVSLHLAGAGSSTSHTLMARGTAIAWPDKVATDDLGRWRLSREPTVDEIRFIGGRRFLTFRHDRMAPVVVDIEQLQPVDDVVTTDVTMTPGTALAGIVLGPDGKPVAGAEVWAHAVPWESRLTQTASQSVSDNQGRFALTELERRTYALDIFAPGCEALNAKVDVGRPPPSPWTLHLRGGTTIRGRVLRADGRPLPYLEMGVTPEGPATPVHVPGVVSGPDGTFEFSGVPLGPATLYPFRRVFPARKLTLATPPLELRVPPRREVVIEFVDANTAQPLRVEGTATISNESLSEVIELDDQDRASFGLVLEGDYEVHVTADGFLIDSQTLTVRRGPGREVVRCALGAGFALTGRVVDTRGVGVADATVYAATTGRWTRRETRTAPDGSYRLGGLDDGRALVGNAYVFVVAAPGKALAFNFETFAAFSVFDRSLDFTLEDGATVRGRVTSADGTPVVGTLVRAYPKQLFVKVPLQASTDSTDADGRYELRNVPSGSVAVTFGAETRTLSLKDGETRRLDVTLPRSPVASPPGSR